MKISARSWCKPKSIPPGSLSSSRYEYKLQTSYSYQKPWPPLHHVETRRFFVTIAKSGLFSVVAMKKNKGCVCWTYCCTVVPGFFGTQGFVLKYQEVGLTCEVRGIRNRTPALRLSKVSLGLGHANNLANGRVQLEVLL